MLTVDFRRLGLRPGDRVIDMGCGAGRHAFEMYRRGADVVAFDQNADELADVLADLYVLEGCRCTPHADRTHGTRLGPNDVPEVGNPKTRK